ncbi:MAG TPA: prephenate dehydrogenase [Candidatus Acidoferrales bacterium]|nr:prephenate dehydrogenase [Candidatus Acidoferrales bacterium]
MSDSAPFNRVAIIGTGLIGASFGLALKSAYPNISIVVFDKPEILQRINERGLGWHVARDVAAAARDAQLIYLALPIGATMEVLPIIAGACDAEALVTDTGSTKVAICRVAEGEFRSGARFLGGHPIAGKESSGMGNADAALFRGTRYVVIGNERESDERVLRFVELVRAIGAEPVWSDADTHDWAIAIVSQMPQLMAVALARVIADETDETGLPVSLAGRGLRDLLRIAGSPYHVWRDICLTNAENIGRSLDRAAQAIDFLRTHLTSRELEQEFHAANELYKSLHNKRPDLQ